MKAVYIAEFGGPEGLEIREVADPAEPQAAEVLVRVRAAGLNRADLLQRKGLYPPPEGVSPRVPGLEFAGEVADMGPEANGFEKGDRVFGIAAGESQAEYLLSDASLLARIPDGLSFAEAAALPEAFVTAHDAMVTQAGLRKGETLLIHGIGSGVGLAALQLGKAIGARVMGTSRTQEKLEKCRELGLDDAILVDDASKLAETVNKATGGAGVNIILDLVGGPYFEQNLRCIAVKGRLMLIGLTGGRRAAFDMGIALAKRITITGTLLRPRSTAEKAAAMRAFAHEVLPLFDAGTLRPNLDRIFAFADVRAAHECMEANRNFGKIVLEW